MNPFKFFATGSDKPLIQDQEQVDKLYKKRRRGITEKFYTWTDSHGHTSSLRKPVIRTNNKILQSIFRIQTLA